MSQFIRIIIPLLLFYIFLIYLRKKNTEVDVVRSKIDGMEYIVQNLPDKQQAADKLAIVKSKLLQLVNAVSSKIEKDDEIFKENILLLVKRFDPNVITESGADGNYSTYTLNKGEKIVFCLRARDETEHLHDLNLLLFVAIHELAHVMTKSQGHTDEFRKNFLYLLEKAIKYGIYKPENFRQNPRKYCGIDVTDTPLNDEHFK